MKLNLLSITAAASFASPPAAVLALALACFAHTAQAQGSSNTGGSVALATMSVLAAPAGSALASSQGQNAVNNSMAVVAGGFLITAMSAQGASVNLILTPVNAASNTASNAAKVSVTMAESAAKAVGVSVGTAITAVSEGTGTSLIATGKVLAFVPNAAGEALLARAKMPGGMPGAPGLVAAPK